MSNEVKIEKVEVLDLPAPPKRTVETDLRNQREAVARDIEYIEGHIAASEARLEHLRREREDAVELLRGYDAALRVLERIGDLRCPSTAGGVHCELDRHHEGRHSFLDKAGSHYQWETELQDAPQHG